METETAKFSPIRLARKITVFGYGYLLLYLFRDGQIHRYLGQRFHFVAVVGAVVLVVFAVVYGSARSGHENAGLRAWLGLLFVAAPVVLGFVSQAGALGAAHAGHHHASVFGPPGSYPPDALTKGGPGAVKAVIHDPKAGKSVRVLFTQINIMELGTILQNSGDTYTGGRVAVRGFVMRDADAGKGRFALTRYTIICCVVHATAVSITVAAPEAGKLETDAWVTVYGTVQKRKPHGESELPYEIKAQKIEQIPAPGDPYIDRWKTERPFVF